MSISALVLLQACTSCPTGWSYVPNSAKCFKMSIATGMWEDNVCESETAGSEMISVADQAELSFLQQQGANGYVGISRLESTRAKWKWRSSSSYNKWQMGHPQPGTDCACLGTTTSSLIAVCKYKEVCSCSCPSNVNLTPYDFLGEHTNIGSCAGKVMDGVCREYKQYASLNSQSADTLAVIRSEVDRDAIVDYVENTLNQRAVVVDLNYRNPDSFTFYDTTESLDRSLWHFHEPDHTSPCSYIGDPCDTGYVCDHPCNEVKVSLCETPSVNGGCPLLWTLDAASSMCYAATSSSSMWSATACSTLSVSASYATPVLASPRTKDVLNLVTNPLVGMWISLNSLETVRRDWGWFTQFPTQYTTTSMDMVWKTNLPNLKECAYMSSGSLVDASCGESHTSVCEEAWTASCTGSKVGNKCFSLTASSQAWGQQSCVLATIETDQEFSAIDTLVRTQFVGQSWVGLNSLERFRGWKWLSGSTTYDMNTHIWDISNLDLTSDCGVVGSCQTGKLCVSLCHTTRRHVCTVAADLTAEPTTAPETAIPALPTANPTVVPTVVPTLVPVPPQTQMPPPSTNTTDAPPTLVPTIPPISRETIAPTQIPATSVPSLPGAEEVETIGTVAAGVSALSAFASPSAAIYASQMALVLSTECNPKTDWSKLSRMSHPTQWELQDNILVGGVISNLGLIGVFYIVHSIVTAITLPFMNTLLAAQGLLRFPSAGLFVFLFLYQGTAFCAIRLVAHEQRYVYQSVIGFMGLLICLVVPVVAAYHVARLTPSVGWRKAYNPYPKCRYIEDPETKGKLIRYLIGRGEWVSVPKDCKWDQRYTTVLRPYHETGAWYGSLLQCVAMLLLAVCSSQTTPTLESCGHVKLMSAIVYLVLMTANLILRPFCRERDLVIETIINLLLASSLLSMGAGFYAGKTEGAMFEASAVLAQIALGFILLKVVLEIISEVIILITDRRDKLQDLQWSQADDAMKLVLLDDFGTELINLDRQDTMNGTAFDDIDRMQSSFPSAKHTAPAGSFRLPATTSSLSIFGPSPSPCILTSSFATTRSHGPLTGKNPSEDVLL